MKLRSIALNNLRRRKARFAFLTLGLTVGVAAVVTLITLTASMTGDIGRKLDEFGANILITPRADDLAMNYGGLSLGQVTFDQEEIRQSDLAAITTIENRKNIAAISPKVLGGVQIGDRRLLLVGVNFDEEQKMKQWWRVFGDIPGQGNELLMGSVAADTLGVMPGDKVTIGQESFRVTGVLEQTGSQDDSLLFLELSRAQKLLHKEGKITLVEVAALCSGCPIGAMVNQIAVKIPTARVTAIQQVVESRLHALDRFKRFSLVMAGVVIFIGSLMVFVTMMGSVNERTVEIGVFRAIGFRKGHIMRIILLEATLVSFLAGILGYLVGLGAAYLALPLMAESSQTVLVHEPMVAVIAVLLAVVMGVLAALYPALHASKKDPVEALRAL
jgi:putative ABC transport system permease protein